MPVKSKFKHRLIVQLPVSYLDKGNLAAAEINPAGGPWFVSVPGMSRSGRGTATHCNPINIVLTAPQKTKFVAALANQGIDDRITIDELDDPDPAIGTPDETSILARDNHKRIQP